MTVSALSHIERLLDAGATVVGIRPESSPSLADDPTAFREVCDRIWAPDRLVGRVVAEDLAPAMARARHAAGARGRGRAACDRSRVWSTARA